MTEYPTRRALREAERRGESLAPSPVTLLAKAESPELPVAPDPAPQQLTRRQLRNAGVDLPAAPVPTSAEVVEKKVETQTARPSVSSSTITSRRQLREAVPAPIEVPEIEVPEAEFTGQNLLAEPSTAAIVLERAPEAIELPIETGEITITGSIQVITGPVTGPSTATVDNVSYDDELEDGAVTGVISTVEPISALELIGERSATGVVPNSVLRRGWWKPLAFGLMGLLLTLATIWATLTILGAGG